MVTPRDSMDEAIQAVHTWMRRLPPGVVEVTEVAEGHGYVIRLRPGNAEAAKAELHIGADGTFGLYVGTALRIDTLPLSAAYVTEICEALQSGSYEEQTWSAFGSPQKTFATLMLPSGNLYNTESRGILGAFGFRPGVPTLRRYAAYV